MWQEYKIAHRKYYDENNTLIEGQGALVCRFLGTVVGAFVGGLIGGSLESWGVAEGSYLVGQIGTAIGASIGAAAAPYVTKGASFIIAVIQAAVDRLYHLAYDNSANFKSGYDWMEEQLKPNQFLITTLTVAIGMVVGPKVFSPILGFLLPPNKDKSNAVNGEKIGHDYGQGVGAVIGYVSSTHLRYTFNFIAGLVTMTVLKPKDALKNRQQTQYGAVGQVAMDTK